jgi:hypothetical protein
MPDVIVILQELSNSYRQVFTDGRKLPEDPNPSWVGYSVGRWEADTLVVESNGFNDKTQLDAFHPHSEALHLTERYRRRDLGHMEIEMTVNDPKTYTKPWTVKLGMELITEGDLLESVCNENEKDVSHLVGK